MSDLAELLAYSGAFKITANSADGNHDLDVIARVAWDEDAWITIDLEEPGRIHLQAYELRGMAEALDMVRAKKGL